MTAADAALREFRAAVQHSCAERPEPTECWLVFIAARHKSRLSGQAFNEGCTARKGLISGDTGGAGRACQQAISPELRDNL